DADAQTFHRNALLWLEEGGWSAAVGARFYEQLLAAIYAITTPSLYVGQIVSVLAYVLSCWSLVNIMRTIGIRNRISVLCLFSLPMPALILSSVTMREPYQVLFFMLSVWFIIKFLLTKRA